MSPPFVAVDPNIASNKKTWALVAATADPVASLSWSAADWENAATMIVGHVVRVLGKVFSEAPDGDLSACPPAQIESWAGWHGTQRVFAAAFLEHYTTGGVLNGWEKRNGSMLRRRDEARERMRLSRERLREQRANEQANVREQFSEQTDERARTVRIGSAHVLGDPNPNPNPNLKDVKTASTAATATVDNSTPWPLAPSFSEDEWPEPYRAAVREQFASLANHQRTAIRCELGAIRDGMHGPAFPASHIAGAVNDLIAKGKMAKPSLNQLRAFIRDWRPDGSKGDAPVAESATEAEAALARIETIIGQHGGISPDDFEAIGAPARLALREVGWVSAVKDLTHFTRPAFVRKFTTAYAAAKRQA